MRNALLTKRLRGFTLMETVIAIGVVAVLLTGFMIVFGPAAQGIRKSISSQEADRLVSALEQELVNTRLNEPPLPDATGFENALHRIKNSTGDINDTSGLDPGPADNALFVYQYRGSLSTTRPDGTPEPLQAIQNERVGVDYVLVPMMRRRDSLNFADDVRAIEGSLFLVKCAQMVYFQEPPGGANAPVQLTPVPPRNSNGARVSAKVRGQIYDPSLGSADTPVDVDRPDPSNPYPEAVIAFRAEFYRLPSKATGYLTGEGFADFYERASRPTFVRNLAVRR